MIRGSKSPTRPRDPEGRSMAHRFTIGVEEEFQIIDPATCELRSHVSQLVSEASPDIAEQVKNELHQSIVETGTRICDNVSELRIEMHRTRGELVAAAERAGLQAAAGRRHAPLLELDRPGDFSGRTLPAHHRRDGTTGEVAAYLRDACARGDAG